MADYTREELISICVDAVVPMDNWRNRDSARSHEKLGQAWALLRAGAPFTVCTEPSFDTDHCITDDHTIWIEIEWEGFGFYDWDGDMEHETFYLPTRKRLAESDGDWY